MQNALLLNCNRQYETAEIQIKTFKQSKHQHYFKQERYGTARWGGAVTINSLIGNDQQFDECCRMRTKQVLISQIKDRIIF